MGGDLQFLIALVFTEIGLLFDKNIKKMLQMILHYCIHLWMQIGTNISWAISWKMPQPFIKLNQIRYQTC